MSIRSAGPAAVPTAEELQKWQKRWSEVCIERDAALDELTHSRSKVDTLRAEINVLKSQNYEQDREASRQIAGLQQELSAVRRQVTA